MGAFCVRSREIYPKKFEVFNKDISPYIGLLLGILLVKLTPVSACLYPGVNITSYDGAATNFGFELA